MTSVVTLYISRKKQNAQKHLMLDQIVTYSHRKWIDHIVQVDLITRLFVYLTSHQYDVDGCLNCQMDERRFFITSSLKFVNVHQQLLKPSLSFVYFLYVVCANIILFYIIEGNLINR